MNNFQLPEKEITKARDILNKPDGIIAFPTDTVWGIGCNINNEKAIKKIYSAKNRPKNKPLILLGSKIEYLIPYVDQIPDNAWHIINKYLPGAVTLVLPKSKLVSSILTLGFDTIGIRIPDNPPLLDLLEQAVKNHVLATTSANISGISPSLTKHEVELSLGSHIDYILDDYGFLPQGKESTVVSIDSEGKTKILRQGTVEIKF